MTSPRTLLLALLATGAGALVGPGIASAATICVNAPFGTKCDDTETDLQTALDVAQTNDNGADTVLLGNRGFPEAGPFQYPGLPAVDSIDPVTIKGVGNARPVLTAAPGEIVLGVNTATVEGVDIQLPNSGGGVGVQGFEATLRDVRVTGAGGQGIRAEGDLTLDGVHVTGTSGSAVTFVRANGRATGLRTSDVDTGVSVGDDAHVQIAQSKVAARDTALSSRGAASVFSSVLETSAPNARGVRGGDGTVSLDHVTVAHRGPVDGTDSALELHPVDFGGRADLSSVVLAGYTRGFRRDTTENDASFPITIRDSLWDPSRDVFVAAPNTGGVSESGNAHVDPALVDLANGDLRLRGTSPGVDRDTQSDAGYKDVDGGGLVGGAADAGALEYRRRPPSIDAVSVPASGAPGEQLSFSASASDEDADALSITWDFGDGGIGAGAQATHAFSAPGIRTVTLRVTDEAGSQTTRTFSIAVTGGGGAPTGGGKGDTVAPKLSKVRLSKNHRKVLFTVSERAKVRVTVRGRTIVKTVPAGRRSIRLGRVRPGVLKIRATDRAGNRSAARRLVLRAQGVRS